MDLVANAVAHLNKTIYGAIILKLPCGKSAKSIMPQANYFMEELFEVHDLPEIFHFWSLRYVRPKLEEVFAVSTIDDFYLKYIFQYRTEHPAETLQIASIGAGNSDMEINIARLLLERGFGDFRFSCLDINPAMLARGRQLAAEKGLADHFEFLEADVGRWQPAHPVAVVIAHHSLHHIQNLEEVFAAIRAAIGETGYFATCDMIGRNGHMRWPEALEIVHDIWRGMPDRYKYNSALRRFEEMYENWDCSGVGFEGIRAQDILPLLVRQFHFEAFIGYGNLPDVFVDRGFGHNFDVANSEDTAFIDGIGALNDRLIGEGVIKPTQMMAAMQACPRGQARCYQHWSPEFCVRPVPA
jgi:SAM-dependent methyltransferase